MIEAACAALYEEYEIDIGGEEMRRVLQAALAKAPQSAVARREPDAYEFNGILYRWIADVLKSQARPLYYGPVVPSAIATRKCQRTCVAPEGMPFLQMCGETIIDATDSRTKEE
jgi:hypothetical protein